jgi:hypothetical protein
MRTSPDASADENSVQLQSDPAFLTPPASVVKHGSFCCIPCWDSQGYLVSSNELIKCTEQALTPHPFFNPAKPGRISARSAWNDMGDEESGEYYFRLNVICYYLLHWQTLCARASSGED